MWHTLGIVFVVHSVDWVGLLVELEGGRLFFSITVLFRIEALNPRFRRHTLSDISRGGLHSVGVLIGCRASEPPCCCPLSSPTESGSLALSSRTNVGVSTLSLFWIEVVKEQVQAVFRSWLMGQQVLLNTTVRLDLDLDWRRVWQTRGQRWLLRRRQEPVCHRLVWNRVLMCRTLLSRVFLVWHWEYIFLHGTLLNGILLHRHPSLGQRRVVLFPLLLGPWCWIHEGDSFIHLVLVFWISVCLLVLIFFQQGEVLAVLVLHLGFWELLHWVLGSADSCTHCLHIFLLLVHVLVVLRNYLSLVRLFWRILSFIEVLHCWILEFWVWIGLELVKPVCLCIVQVL